MSCIQAKQTGHIQPLKLCLSKSLIVLQSTSQQVVSISGSAEKSQKIQASVDTKVFPIEAHEVLDEALRMILAQ